MKVPKVLLAKRPYIKKNQQQQSVTNFNSGVDSQASNVQYNMTVQPYQSGYYESSANSIIDNFDNLSSTELNDVSDIESLKKLYDEISAEIKTISKAIGDSSNLSQEGDLGLRYKLAKDPTSSSIFLVKTVLESLSLGAIAERDIRYNLVSTCKELGIKMTNRGTISCNLYNKYLYIPLLQTLLFPTLFLQYFVYVNYCLTIFL